MWRFGKRDVEVVSVTNYYKLQTPAYLGRLKRLLQEANIPPWQRDQLRVARMHDGTVAGLWHPSRGWWLLAVLTQQ